MSVAALASLSWLVRSVIDGRAEAMGLEVGVESVRMGFGTVRLRDMTITSRDVPAIRVRLDHVVVNPDWRLRLERLEVHGGVVSIEGPVADVMRQLETRRPSRARPGGSHSGGAAIQVDGLSVVWKGALASRQVQHVWGLAYVRESTGEERARVDRMRLAWGSTGLEVVSAEIGVRRTSEGRVVDRVSAGRVEGTLDLDDAALRDGLELAMSRPGAPQAPVRKRANAERGPALRKALARLAGAAEAALAAGATVDVTGVRLKVMHEGQALNVGPGRFEVRRDLERASLALLPGAADQRAPMKLSLVVPLGDGPVLASMEGGPVRLAALGVREGDMGLIDVDRATVDARGTARLAPDGSKLGLDGRVRLGDLSIAHPKLAPEPVENLSIGLSGKVETSLDGSTLDLDDVELTFGKVRAALSGRVENDGEDVRADLKVRVPLASCQDWFDSTPRALVPLLQGIRLSGTFSFDGSLTFDTRQPTDMKVSWRVANECRITAVPADIHPERFARPWSRVVERADGNPMEIESGPGTADWVPLYDISRHMETAVLVCEDSRFWVHGGFDHEAIRDSIRDNVAAGRFVRGASTISMQLAKNLYLGREKTLSRKLQEAALTLLLEQELGKDRLLELYFNVIEFAPGIYGIGPAARYYFNSSARDLSLGQSLYLTSILPNPKSQHFTPEGYVTEKWEKYLERLMRIAHKIRRISDEELEAGLEETVSFGQPYSGSDALEGSADEAAPDVFFGP